ncbi:MAG: hypothetical protein LBL49_10800 [Clostridiales Family XIII bacterium]|jgi:hypothetical protein|nr:hypothetical protein [Clostridiales Family XIII bacterium]
MLEETNVIHGESKRERRFNAIVLAVLFTVMATIAIFLPNRGTEPAPYTLFLSGNELYFVDKNLYVYHTNTDVKEKISSQSGTLWQTDTGIYFSTKADIVYAVQNESLREIGKMTLDGKSVNSPLAFIDCIDGLIYWRAVRSRGMDKDDEQIYNKLYATDINTGKTNAVFAPDYAINSIQISNGMAYYTTDDDRLESFDIHTGRTDAISSGVLAFTLMDDKILIKVESVWLSSMRS